MTETQEPTSDELLDRASLGDNSAVHELLERSRERLRRLMSIRMDHRLTARIDPSDVVQEALASAYTRLPEYLESRPVAFYPWIRQLAIQRLVDLHRMHVDSKRRSVNREVALNTALPDESAIHLYQLSSGRPQPLENVLRRELRSRVVNALGRLPDKSREILDLRFVEQLSSKEAADVLGISVTAVQGRQFRALAAMRLVLDDLDQGGSNETH